MHRWTGGTPILMVAGIMQKLFDAVGEHPAVLVAANEEFPCAEALPAATPEDDGVQVRGWSAYEIWHSRIRRQPGMTSLFLQLS
ncbi:MAG TPA: hypothetical protein VII70_04760 [Steroidobacteraceae bacterium]